MGKIDTAAYVYPAAPVSNAQLDALCAGLRRLYIKRLTQVYTILTPEEYRADIGYEVGKRYARYWKEDCGQRSAYIFVDLETGDILMPAGWKVPAKGIRGSIHTSTCGVEFCNAHGPKLSYVNGKLPTRK